jgi:outer membrane protein assembly factor BamB
VPMLARATPVPTDWDTFGGGPARTFDNPTETQITAANVAQLVPEWRFPTAEPVTASAAVATVNVAGTPTRVVYDGDFAGMFYALNANTGLPLWEACLVEHAPAPAPVCNPAYPTNPTAQVDYGTIVASPAVANVGSTAVVFEASNASVWALDAATGKPFWPQPFNAAGQSGVPNYEIEASPLVVPNPAVPGAQLVVFSIDCNGFCAKPGGVYAVDAASGNLVWFFSPTDGKAYTPGAPTNSFGPTDAGAASAGEGACGGIWASESADLTLKDATGTPTPLLFTGSADCPNNEGASPYYEAVFALNLATGTPRWSWQPRPLDTQDMDFGATPNVYTINTPTGPEDVVGEGSKDGSYTLFDALNGPIGTPTPGVCDLAPCPLWSDKLTPGGNFGGFYNGTTDGSRIYLTSSIGTLSATTVSAADDAAKGREWALDAKTGRVLTDQVIGTPTFGQDSAIPGVYFASGLDHAVHAYDTTADPPTLNPLAVLPTAGATSSSPVVSGDQLFVGAGTGSTYRAAVGESLDPTGITGVFPPVGNAIPLAPVPMPIYEDGQGIWAFCLATDASCVSHGVVGG